MMIEKHTQVLTCHITVGSADEKVTEMKRQIIAISDRYGGRLLRDHLFLASVATASGICGTELERAQARLDEGAEIATLQRLQEGYRTLNQQQKAVFDEVMGCLEQRKTKNTLQTDGKVLFLQGHAGTGMTYLLSLLWEIAESRGMFVEITATTSIAASLYRGGRTQHSLMGLGVEDKDCSTRQAKQSKHGRRSQRAEYLRHVSLLVVDEASIMQRILLEHKDTILEDLRCRLNEAGGNSEATLTDLPYFGGLTVVCCAILKHFCFKKSQHGCPKTVPERYIW